ncbi:unnamed protein product [Sphagnum jensenii]|uniref:Uncharacterized protein n=1 Tax=Sphagnum jensenii TaxID=128206 RepID=A0ABP1A0A1_9BRYO
MAYLGGARGQTMPAPERRDFIQAERMRIDKLDGLEDGKVETHDSARNVLSHQAYFEWPDSIDLYIASSDFSDADKKNYRDYFYQCLRRVSGSNYRKVSYFSELFHHVYKEIVAIHDHRLYSALKQNLKLSIQTCGLYRSQPEADSFLCYASRKEPDEIFRNVDDFSDMPYAQHVIDYTAVYAPEVAKKYLLTNNPVLNILKTSTDSGVKVILKITDDFGKKSNAYVLLDPIVRGTMTIAQANAIGANPKTFFVALNNVRKKKDPIGAYSLEKELEIQSLKLVRQINDLHNEKNSVRFACVDDFTPDQLYTLIVYSEEDIFTSTFDGIFKRLMSRLGRNNGFKMIQMTGDNHFRTFIKQCAGYGKLDSFLVSMSLEQRRILMIKFAANLDKDENDISQAVEVADAYTSIKDPMIQVILQQTFSIELQRVSIQKNKKGIVMYELLLNLFVHSRLYAGDWYNDIAKTYNLPPLDILPSSRLFETNHGRCIWQICFYDDIDGDVSFRDFIKTFRDSMWIIEDHPLYVKIMSVGDKPVDIYANKPKAEYEGQAWMDNYFDSLSIVPDVLVHRGHSYYAYKTIEKTKPGTRIFVMGSCGGYHNLSNVIDKSPEVSIISSKQIGVHMVNNPILRALADNVASGKDINWQVLWDRIDQRLKGTPPVIYDKWLDYIPPHKNLGAIFIRSYTKLVEY